MLLSWAARQACAEPGVAAPRRPPAARQAGPPRSPRSTPLPRQDAALAPYSVASGVLAAEI